MEERQRDIDWPLFELHRVVHTISAFSASERWASGSAGRLAMLNSDLRGGLFSPESSPTLLVRLILAGGQL